jgi:Protein of unknown function DUF2620.
MIKVVVGGQISKQEIANLICKLASEKMEVVIKSDLDAAMDVQNGLVDYYFGACNTGGGGALAMAIALAGAEKCATVSMPGTIKSNEEIIDEVKKGKVAFGFTAQHIEQVVPVIVQAILNEGGEN